MKTLLHRQILAVSAAALLLGAGQPLRAAEPTPLPLVAVPQGKDATGCSRQDDDRGSPMGYYQGSCRSGYGGGCYRCEYSNEFGYTICLENGDGSEFICHDFQQY